jgi:hypothetical protein
MRGFFSIFKLSVLLLATSSPALAEDPVDPASEAPVAETAAAPTDEPLGLVLGLKVGGAFSGVFNTFGPALSPEFELGFRLPRLDRAFEVFTSLRYAAPSTSGEILPDPRLPGDQIARWTATRSELSIGLGLRFRLELDPITPYIAAGGRLYLIDTRVSGDVAEASFGRNHEVGRTWGFLFALGGEYALGPGRLLLELAINGAPLDKTVLADTNTTSLDTYLGYRIFF